MKTAQLNIFRIVLDIFRSSFSIRTLPLLGAGAGKANKLGGKGKGMAIAGIATGAVGLLLGIYMIWAVFVAIEEVERHRNW